MTTGTVVVLGDIGRSPRMQYHCISLANAGVDVRLFRLCDDLGQYCWIFRKEMLRRGGIESPNILLRVIPLVSFLENYFFCMLR